jgi:hypothetical protein
MARIAAALARAARSVVIVAMRFATAALRMMIARVLVCSMGGCRARA